MHSRCPRCAANLTRSGLTQDAEALLCPEGHGMLLPLAGFTKQTNRSFVKAFWRFWNRIGHQKSISCPSCGTRMETLSDEFPATLILDCCPGCFALWLDSGENEEIQRFFQDGRFAQERPSFSSEDPINVMARFVLEHENTMMRYEELIQLGNFLNQPVRLWRRFYGLFGLQ